MAGHEHDPDRTELLGARQPAPAAGHGLAPGTPLGRYRIEALLGRGGMGEVYRAEQLEPVRRTVALKLLRAQRLDARHIAYFEIERQVLAQMRHPAIAQIFDADTTPDGHPFFAMEYIQGRPITQYCADHGVPLARRIELFVQVCEGVQHAHQKGVIHRDLKPGNLLVDEVDGRAHPKVIDFGIATASSLANARDVAGTPDYMSPEQAAGDQALVDIRSDVYSLGVVLYELLTGRRPFSAGETVTAQSHTLRLPSEQLATLPPDEARLLARTHGQRLGAIRHALRSELDWVVAKAMRHDRNQRYASVAAMAEDLRRFLDGRAVLAVPPSRRYLWGKFAVRHRVALASGAVVALALVGGLVLSLYGLMEAREQRALAQLRGDELEKVASFQQSMLENIDVQAMGLGLADDLRAQVRRSAPALSEGLEQVLAVASPTDLARSLVERDILGNATEAIGRDFGDQPAVAANLREAAGRVHEALGMYDKALEVQAEVVAYRMAALGPRDPATLRARLAQAVALQRLSRYDEARAMLEAAQRDAASLAEDDATRVGIDFELSETVLLQGDLADAVARRRARLQRLASLRGESDPLILSAMSGLAAALARAGDVAEARVLMEQVLPLRLEAGGEDDAATLAAMGMLATMRALQSDFASAVELQGRLVTAQTRRLGREHPDTLAARNNLANMLSGNGETERALGEAEAVLASRTRIFGAEHPQTLRSALNVATFHARLENYDAGLPLEARVLDARKRILGPDHPDTLFIHINHGVTLQRAGRSRDALAVFDVALLRAVRVLGEKHPQYQTGLLMSGEALIDSGRASAGIEVLRRTLALNRTYGAPDSPEALLTAWMLVRGLRDAGRKAEADALQQREIDPVLAADPETLAPGLRARRDDILRQIREG